MSEKLICKVIVGSQLHGTATPESDIDYRGIFINDLKLKLSPFKRNQETSWIEGEVDDTSYELAHISKMLTTGNATCWEILFSNKIIETSDVHQEMRENWKKFFTTDNFIKASIGYSRNQYAKFGLYDDIGVLGQKRTAKFVIAFLRVMWQCEQFLLTGEFKCSLKESDKYDYIMSIKGKSRDEINISEAFANMEDMYARVAKAQSLCDKSRLEMKADIDWIEDFIYRSYKKYDKQLTKEV